MKPMTITGNHDTDSIGSIILTVFAAIFSWQEHAEWVFRMFGLVVATSVSLFVLYGHLQKHFPKWFKKRKT